ncbi:MAG: hypothetical protein JXQ87_13635 [Bacteroidia bacterium]
MSDSEEYFYPVGEFLDSKWKVIQEYILKLSKGQFDIEIPENLNKDHIDAVLLGLKYLSESLDEQKKLYKAQGVLESLDKALFELDENYNIKALNTNAKLLFGNTDFIAKSIFTIEPFNRIKESFVYNQTSTELIRQFQIHIDNKVFDVELMNFGNSLYGSTKGYLLKVG